MKRLRSYDDDLASAAGEKDLDRTASSHHRRFYSKGQSENGRRRPSPAVDEDRSVSMRNSGGIGGRSPAVDDDRSVSLRIGGGIRGRSPAVDDDRSVSLRNGGGIRGRSPVIDDDWSVSMRNGGGIRRRSPAVDDDRSVILRNGGGISSSFDERGSFSRKRVDHDFLDNFDDREGFRVRKRADHDGEGFDRRKGFDRYGRGDRDGGVSSSSLVSPRGGGYVVERERERERDRERSVHRSESFCTSRREFPKGFRSERHWSRREDGGSSSWLKFDGRSKKDADEDSKSSPVEKGGGGSSSSRGGLDSGCGGVSNSRESLRSPGVKDGKSPTWSRDSTRDSKDSGGEPSKDTKKNESMAVESGGSASGVGSGSASGVGIGSDMEEGELQPESHQVAAAEHQSVSEHIVETSVDSEHANYRGVDRDERNKLCEVRCSQREESCAADSVAGNEKLAQRDENMSLEKDVWDAKQPDFSEVADNKNAKEDGVFSNSQNGSLFRVADGMQNTGSASQVCEAVIAVDGNLTGNQPQHSAPTSSSLHSKAKAEDIDKRSIEKPQNNFDLEVGLDEPNKSNKESEEETESCPVALKDKGKGVAICSPGEVSIRESSLLIERNFIPCSDHVVEGSSARGFELFSSSAGVKAESASRSGGSKAETEELKLEPLDLSLGLPNVSVPTASNNVAVPTASNNVAAPTAFNNVAAPTASNNAAAPPSSPSRARSFQSFGTTLRTGSDCFTTSISFSGSQFIHNPSCSLTHNSVDCDFEQSVKSRPLFQGFDWQALSVHDTLPKEIAAKQKLIANGNGSVHFSHASQGVLNGRAIQQQGMAPALDRSTSFQRQLSGKSWYQEEHRSPAQSAGSHDTRSEYGKDKKRLTGEESVSRLFRSSSQSDMEPGVGGERELVERMIYAIICEQIQQMAWRINEMSERAVIYLKDSTCDIILKEEYRGKLRALQEVLRKRSDLNLETLLKSHRVQLQILVAVKTGLTDFIQRADSVSSSDLAEIYLNLKCRNSNCRSALPVDDCECRFCCQKEGFCSSCMCLVCSKFDTASNTCGWVGCDVCNHWCHTDCGLTKSYIKNGRSASTTQGTTEMQFYCVACDHPSEMFGFVKDVFKTCATEWKAETLLKELEYIRRIFSASNDSRGRLLQDAAKQLSIRLQNGANAVEVCQQILAILNECESRFSTAVASSGRELQLQSQSLEKSRGSVADRATPLGPDANWSKPISAKGFSRVENAGIPLPTMEGKPAGGASSWNPEMLTGMSRKPVVDELDSIIKVKQAEAEMFQKRADDARREAEGLQRIVISKNEKIEEEYAGRIAKLCLSEVEDRRRQKQEELQMLERSHREYFNMKTRMETDIKDLLFKMETTRRNLTT